MDSAMNKRITETIEKCPLCNSNIEPITNIYMDRRCYNCSYGCYKNEVGCFYSLQIDKIEYFIESIGGQTRIINCNFITTSPLVFNFVHNNPGTLQEAIKFIKTLMSFS